MRIALRPLLLTVFMAVLLAEGQFMLAAAQASAAPPQPAAAQSSLSVALSAVQDSVPAGSPVRVKAVVTNVSSSTVRLFFVNLGDESAWVYRVDVRDAKGNPPFDTKLGRLFKYNSAGGSPNVGVGTILGGNGRFVSLMPGESDTNIIDVSARFDLSQPGQYTIQVQRAAWGESASATSNAVTVTVNPASTPASSSSVPAGTPPFSLSIAALAQDANSLSTVELKVKTTNLSDHNILVWAEDSKQEQGGVTYRVDVNDVNGKPVSLTAFHRQARSRRDVPSAINPATVLGTSGERLILKPGEDWTDTINLNKLYDLKEPGDYTVQVERFDPSTKIMVKSNMIKLTIAP